MNYNEISLSRPLSPQQSELEQKLLAQVADDNIRAVSFKLEDIKSITVRDNGTGIKTVIDGDMLNSCIKQLSDDKMNETSEADNKPVLYEVTFNYNDGTSENVVVYYGDVLSYKSKYYEEGRNLAEVISGNIK